MPQLATMTSQSGRSVNLRWPYQAVVMNTFETSSRTMGNTAGVSTAAPRAIRFDAMTARLRGRGDPGCDPPRSVAFAAAHVGVEGALLPRRVEDLAAARALDLGLAPMGRLGLGVARIVGRGDQRPPGGTAVGPHRLGATARLRHRTDARRRTLSA